MTRIATMSTTNHPLRLAVGNHKAGSGKGCAMNVISWESGDTTITDFPACADRMLARIVQRVNDTICDHRNGDLLCPECSVKVLALGHRIVGTGTHPMTDLDRRRAWVRVAVDQARQVAHLNTDPRVMAAIVSAERWADEPTATYAYAYAAAATAASAASAASASDAAAYATAHAAVNAAYAAVYAAYAAVAATTIDDACVDAAANAAYAASAADTSSHAAAAYADTSSHAADTSSHAAAAYAANAESKMQLAHRAVDKWCEYTGFTPTPTAPEATAVAVAKMQTVTA